MNRRTRVCLLALLNIAWVAVAVAPLGTAFTYQGRLSDGANPANGGYDLAFSLYDAPTNGSLVGWRLTNTVSVGNGVFAVALDFGAGVFNGAASWLEISVRPAGATTEFTRLEPRQPVMPVPYALYAASAGGVASLANTPLDLTVDGQRALRLEPAPNGVNVIGGWLNNFVTPGVSGATIGGGGGTADNAGDPRSYTNHVTADFGTVGGGGDNTSGWYATVGGGLGNVSDGAGATVAGGNGNISSGYSGTVGGGSYNTNGGDWATTGGGFFNTNSGNYATVSGGYFNRSSGEGATVGGGVENLSDADWATVSGGSRNVSSGDQAAVGGGLGNVSSAQWATVSGGYYNTSSVYCAAVGGGAHNLSGSSYATIPGGYGNKAGGRYSFAAGRHAQALHDGALVWADSQDADFASTATNQFSVRASGGAWFETSGAGVQVDGQPVLLGSTGSQPQEFTVDGQRALRLEPATNGGPNVVGGWSNNVVSTGVGGATIGGGGGIGVTFGVTYNFVNQVQGDYGTVGGGGGNTSSGKAATVAGGQLNNSTASFATVGGGLTNTSSGRWATVGGGEFNTSSGETATVGGGYNNTSSGYGAVVGGGTGNVSSGLVGTVAGGDRNTSSNSYATVAGGQFNIGGGPWAAVGGGINNTSSGVQATVGGGQRNISSGGNATVSGGQQNTSSGEQAAVGGGYLNTSSGRSATVGGGVNNTSSGLAATVSGGALNTAGGQYSFAAGLHAQALHDGSFVWGDSTAAIYPGYFLASTNANSWTVQASGGVRFFSDASATVGAYLPPGGNGFSPMSDRKVKENFKTVDPQAVLEKVRRLPVTEWNLVSQPASTRHIGPTAQDFQAAFGVGEDDRHISTTDADGVALAAIQGLNQKVESENAALREELKRRNAEQAELSRRLSELEARLRQVTHPSAN